MKEKLKDILLTLILCGIVFFIIYTFVEVDSSRTKLEIESLEDLKIALLESWDFLISPIGIALVIWGCLGGYGYIFFHLHEVNDEEEKKDDYEAFAAVIGGPISVAVYAWYYFKDQKIEAQIKEDQEKKIKDAKKRKEKALKDCQLFLKDLKETLKLIKKNEHDIDKKFFDDIKKIISYCTTLNINAIADKEGLKEVLIFARINVLQFYEYNNIKDADIVSKEINQILKKIKND
jgi:hypothetical protein